MERYTKLNIRSKPRDQAIKAPDYAQPWNVRYARWDGGIIHACKAANSGWDAYINDPDMMVAGMNFYQGQSVEFLKRMHINWVWVTWSVGFSHEMEQRSQQQLTEYMRLCAKSGIRCSAYMSMGNVFPDDILRYRPDLYDCRAIHAGGDWLTYGDGAPLRGKPRRRMMCVSNRPWRDYILETGRAAIHAGAIALFFDNCCEGCVCENCRKNYADYTERFWGERMQMPELETGWEMDVISEANQQAQYQLSQAQGQRKNKLMLTVRMFEHWQYDNFLAEIDAEIKKIEPESFVYRNVNLGLDAFRTPPSTVIFTENAAEPGLVQETPPIFEGHPFNKDKNGRPQPLGHLAHIYKPGTLVNNIGMYAYLRAAAGDCRVVRAEPQGRADATQSRFIPPVPRRTQLGLAEAAAAGVNCGRHMDGIAIKEMYYGTETGQTIMDAYGLYNQFFEQHTNLYEASQSIADCLVVVNDNTHSVEVLNRLACQSIVFDVAFPDEITPGQLQRYHQIIVPDYMEWFRRKELHFVPYLSQEAMQMLVDFARAGGKLYVAEQIGLYDQHLDPRDDTAIRDTLLSTPNVEILPVPGEHMPDDQDLMMQLKANMNSPVTLQSPHGVLGITKRVKNRGLVVHILNYADKPGGPVTVKTAAQIDLAALSPDGDVDLKTRDPNTWTLDSVDIYTVLYQRPPTPKP